MAVARAPPHMDRETEVFALLTLGIVAGAAVLIAGVELDVLAVIGTGSAIMVAAILLMALAVSRLEESEEPEGGETTGH